MAKEVNLGDIVAKARESLLRIFAGAGKRDKRGGVVDIGTQLTKGDHPKLPYHVVQTTRGQDTFAQHEVTVQEDGRFTGKPVTEIQHSIVALTQGGIMAESTLFHVYTGSAIGYEELVAHVDGLAGGSSCTAQVGSPPEAAKQKRGRR